MKDALQPLGMLPYFDESDSLVDDSIPNIVDEFVPTIGMCFHTTDGAKSFYRKYDIKIRSSNKGPDKELKYFMLVCARVGKYVSGIPAEMNTQPTQTVECPARITVGIKERKWYIMFVHEEHSHDISSTKSRLFHSNRKISLQTKRVLDINDDVGVRINKTFRSFVFTAGGCDNLDFVE
ncbi:uncharacterized protein [Phaseolus vulgaris]|uniref:uncharacterized protein n=1 Tax=Phaseolus vulgaris TaxID=3885 RepID=UPI0035CBF6FF